MSEITQISLCAWYPDYFLGLVYFGLGLLGSVSTVYLYSGDALPSMGGTARLKKWQVELEEREKKKKEWEDKWEKELEQLHTMIVSSEGSVGGVGFNDRINANQKMVREKRARVRSIGQEIMDVKNSLKEERWRILKIAIPLYVFLGGGFSVLLSKDIVQSILIGAFWTGAASAIGLKRQGEEEVKRDEDNYNKINKIIMSTEENERERDEAETEARKNAYKRGVLDAITTKMGE